MTHGPMVAVARLNELSRLLDHARLNRSDDAVLLSEMLRRADDLLAELAPTLDAARRDPRHADVVAAALRARQSLESLTQAMDVETARLASEIARLTSGQNATSQYQEHGVRTARSVVDRTA